MAELGYVRVSTTDQDGEYQMEEMRKRGVPERFLFYDQATGANFDREQYQIMRKVIRKGDLLYLDALDRLGRDYDGIISEWQYIVHEVGADIVALDMEDVFDSRKFRAMGDMGKLLETQFLSLLAWTAEQERKKIKRRQKEGIALAKAKGIYKGRKRISGPDNWQDVFNRWKRREITGTEAMKEAGLKRNTFYNFVKMEEVSING